MVYFSKKKNVIDALFEKISIILFLLAVVKLELQFFTRYNYSLISKSSLNIFIFALGILNISSEIYLIIENSNYLTVMFCLVKKYEFHFVIPLKKFNRLLENHDLFFKHSDDCLSKNFVERLDISIFQSVIG